MSQPGPERSLKEAQSFSVMVCQRAIYLLCCSRSSSGTLKEKRLLLFMLRTICFLLLSDVSGTTSSSPSGRSQQRLQACLHAARHRAEETAATAAFQHKDPSSRQREVDHTLNLGPVIVLNPA